MHAFVHTFVYACMFLCTNTCMHACICAHIRSCMHVFVHKRMHACMFVVHQATGLPGASFGAHPAFPSPKRAKFVLNSYSFVGVRFRGARIQFLGLARSPACSLACSIAPTTNNHKQPATNHQQPTTNSKQ